MENNELKKVSIKNCTCYYYDNIIKFEDFDLDNILLDEESYKNILIYNIPNKNLIGAKALRIIFDEVDGFRFISVYDGTRHLVLFRPEKYDIIYNRIRYLISQKIIITFGFSHNYEKIKIDSNSSLPLEKT